jgi:hypothetical protein
MTCNTCGLDHTGDGKDCVRCGEPLSRTFFDVLGVGEQATTEEIRMAYRLKIRSVHPDYVQHLSTDLQRLATLRSTQLNNIVEVLSNPDRRQAYREEIARNRATGSAGAPKAGSTSGSAGKSEPADAQSPKDSEPTFTLLWDQITQRFRDWQTKVAGDLPAIGFWQGVFMALLFLAVFFGAAYGLTLGAARVTSMPFLFDLAPFVVFAVKLSFCAVMACLVLCRNKNGGWGRLGLAAVSVFLVVRLWQIDFQSNRRISDRYAAQKRDYSGVLEDIKRRINLSLVEFIADPAKAAEFARSMAMKEIPGDMAGLIIHIQNASSHLIKDTAVSFDILLNGTVIYQHTGMIAGRVEAQQTCGYVFWVSPSSREFRELNSANLSRCVLRVQKAEPLHFGAGNEWVDVADW